MPLPGLQEEMVASQDGLTRRLAHFYSELDYEQLSPEVVDLAKYFCLDYLAVAIRGSIAPSSTTMVGALGRLNSTPVAPVAGTSRRLSPEYAALANGTAAHSLEMDDVNNEASIHPGVPTFPAAFACAHMAQISGASFLAAIVAGYDFTIRLGYALDPQSHYARGFHPTGTCGTFGAALVASRLLGLGADATASAIGIAGSQAAGSLEFLAGGAWTKRMHPGWAAHSGIIAATLAGQGFVGPDTILEGVHGTLSGYSDNAEPLRLTDGLGEQFYITRAAIKPHSCCRYNQGPIDCMLAIRSAHNVRPEDIEGVRVGMLSAGFPIVSDPPEYKQNARSVVDAQFSAPYAIAVAAVCGRASLEEYTDEVIARDDVRDVMARVESVRDPALDAVYPRRWPSWVEVRTTDGRTLRSDVQFPLGEPENPLSWAQLEEKFRSITRPVISDARQDEIIAAIHSLERMEDVRDLDWLTGG